MSTLKLCQNVKIESIALNVIQIDLMLTLNNYIPNVNIHGFFSLFKSEL